MSTETFDLRRSLQMIEMLQMLVACSNPRAVVRGDAFSFRGFAGSVVYNHNEAEFYVFDQKKSLVYGPSGHGGAARSHDPRSMQVMQGLLDEMLSEQKLHVANKLMARQAGR